MRKYRRAYTVISFLNSNTFSFDSILLSGTQNGKMAEEGGAKVRFKVSRAEVKTADITLPSKGVCIVE